MASLVGGGSMPHWEDLLLYSLSVDTRKLFERSVQTAKAARRKKSHAIGDEYIFYQGNKVALPRPEFIEFFRQVLLIKYVEFKNSSKNKSDGGKKQQQKMQQQQRTADCGTSVLAMSNTSGLIPGELDMTTIMKDKSVTGIINSIDYFLNMFFAAADAERSGRVDWDRLVQLVEDVIAAGGIVRLVGGQAMANSMAQGGDGTIVASDSKPHDAQQQQFGDGGSPLLRSGSMSCSGAYSPTSPGRRGTSFGKRDNEDQQQQQQQQQQQSTFVEESKAAAEHESAVGLACASMRLLRVQRFVGERNQSVLPSAGAQLELLKSRLVEAEKHAAMASKRADPVRAATARFPGPPPTRGDMGGSILPPPPMFRSLASALQTPLCNMNQSRVLLDNPFEPSREVSCHVQPIAAAPVSRLQYEPSVGMFTGICKETNEVRFLGESQAFLQRLTLPSSSKVESVALWPTVASSKALAQGAGSIFEACAYSCFAGLLDGTVQLWSLRDTRIGPGMRNVSLKLQTQLPSGYVCCSLHVPYARASSVLTGTSTGDLIHWNFDPHIVDDFMGGSDVSWVQAAAFRKLMVSRRVRLHEGRLMDLCVLGDVGVRDMGIFEYDEEAITRQAAKENAASGAGGGVGGSSSRGGSRPASATKELDGADSTTSGGAGASAGSGGSSGAKMKHIPINVVSVGWDGAAIVTDVAAAPTSGGGGGGGRPSSASGVGGSGAAAAGLRRFQHSAGLLTCCAASESVFGAAGFVTEPHMWDVRAGSTTIPIMKLHDPRSPHAASITSLAVMSHLMSTQLASVFNAAKRKAKRGGGGGGGVSGSGSSGASPLPPLISCDSVGKINIWDLRVGRTLASFDIHSLVDEASDALVNEKEQKCKKQLRRAAMSTEEDGAESAGVLSITDRAFAKDSCKVVLSRRTGRMFVTSDSRSSVCEFGSVAEVDQDPRGAFPSEAVIAVAFVSSQHLVVTAHADVVVLWELSRRNAATTSAAAAAAEKKEMEDQEDDVTATGSNHSSSAGLSPFCVVEVHEFIASDINAAAAAAARDKVLFRDKNSHKPPITTPLRPNERISAFTLHSRGHQYAVGTNQGRVLVARVNGGEVVFLTERSIFPSPSTEVRCLASASAPHLYCDRLTSLSSLIAQGDKTLLQDDTVIAVGSDERVFCVHSLRMQIVALYPKGSPVQCQISRHDVLSVMCGDAPFFYGCDPLVTASIPAFPKPENRHPEVKHHMTAMTVAPWLDVAFLGDSCGRLHCIATKPHPLAEAGMKAHIFSAGFHKAEEDDDDDGSSDSDGERAREYAQQQRQQRKSAGGDSAEDRMLGRSDDTWNRLSLKEQERQERKKAKKKKKGNNSNSPFRAFASDSSSGGGFGEFLHTDGDAAAAADGEEEETNDTTPAISAVAAHHIGSATFQEFTLVVAGTDTGRLGWWQACGEMAELEEEVHAANQRRRRSSQLGIVDDSSGGSTGDFGHALGQGGGRRRSSTSSAAAATAAGRSSGVFGSAGPEGSVTFAGPGKTVFYVKPVFTWLKSCNFHDGSRIESISIFPVARRESVETSALDSIWIAAAASDGRVSLVRAATGEFVALVSAGPASRLGDIAATIAASRERQKAAQANAEKQQRMIEQQQQREKEMAVQAKARAAAGEVLPLDEKETGQQQQGQQNPAPSGRPASLSPDSLRKQPSASAAAASSAAAEFLLSPTQRAARERREREERQRKEAKAAAREVRPAGCSLPTLFFVRRFARNLKVAVARRRREERQQRRRTRASPSVAFEEQIFAMARESDAFAGTVTAPNPILGQQVDSNSFITEPTPAQLQQFAGSDDSAAAAATDQEEDDELSSQIRLRRAQRASFRKDQKQQQQQQDDEQKDESLLEQKPAEAVDESSVTSGVKEESGSAGPVCDEDAREQQQQQPQQKQRHQEKRPMSGRTVQIITDDEEQQAASATVSISRRRSLGNLKLPASLSASVSARASSPMAPSSANSTPQVSPGAVRPFSSAAVSPSSSNPNASFRGGSQRSMFGGSTATLGDAHWGQTMIQTAGSSFKVPQPPPQKVRITYEEMLQRHARYAARTYRAATTMEEIIHDVADHQHEQQQQQSSSSPVAGSRSLSPSSRNNSPVRSSGGSSRPVSAKKNRGGRSQSPPAPTAASAAAAGNNKDSSESSPPPSTGPLLSGPVQLGGMDTETLSPPQSASSALLLSPDGGGVGVHDPDLGFQKDCRVPAEPGAIADPSRPLRPYEHKQQQQQQQQRARRNSEPVVIRDKRGVIVSGGATEQSAAAHPVAGGDLASAAPCAVSSRPSSASASQTRHKLHLARDNVEKALRDVRGARSRFMLPESRERVAKRFAQSVVVSAGSRSIVPLSATIIENFAATQKQQQHGTTPRRPLSSSAATQQRPTSASSSSNSAPAAPAGGVPVPRKRIERNTFKSFNEDPDADMSSKILPPSNEHGEVSARQAADVLMHTSARTNELVARKAAVEHEADRFRFRFDVDSRKRRSALMSRVEKMSGCIDDALTPASLIAIGSSPGEQTMGRASSNAKKQSENNYNHLCGGSGNGGSSAGVKKRPQSARNYYVSQHLEAWMTAPMSAAQPGTNNK